MRQVTQIRVTFWRPYLFVNFTVLSMIFFFTKCLPFFFRTDCNIYQIILLHTLGRGLNKSLIKKNQLSIVIKLLKRNKLDYCFYSFTIISEWFVFSKLLEATTTVMFLWRVGKTSPVHRFSVDIFIFWSFRNIGFWGKAECRLSRC